MEVSEATQSDPAAEEMATEETAAGNVEASSSDAEPETAAVQEPSSVAAVQEASAEGAAQRQKRRGQRRRLVGVVVSDKMDKTIVVMVERRKAHPLYKKYYTRRKKFLAHDEQNECRVGDVVQIMETRPLSRRKRWRLVKILERGQQRGGQ